MKEVRRHCLVLIILPGISHLIFPYDIQKFAGVYPLRIKDERGPDGTEWHGISISSVIFVPPSTLPGYAYEAIIYMAHTLFIHKGNHL